MDPNLNTVSPETSNRPILDPEQEQHFYKFLEENDFQRIRFGDMGLTLKKAGEYINAANITLSNLNDAEKDIQDRVRKIEEEERDRKPGQPKREWPVFDQSDVANLASENYDIEFVLTMSDDIIAFKKERESAKIMELLEDNPTLSEAEKTKLEKKLEAISKELKTLEFIESIVDDNSRVREAQEAAIRDRNILTTRRVQVTRWVVFFETYRLLARVART